jgi:S1-C subfamily serine protease
MRYLFLLLLLLLISCATLPQQVQENLNQNNFSSALILLEEKGVGANVASDADEESLLARKIYENAVVEYYTNKTINEINLGNLRQAHQLSLEALSFCSWSNDLLDLNVNIQSKLDAINKIQNKWKYTLDDDITLADATEISKDIQSVYDYINDTPFLIKLYNKSTKRLMDNWAIRLTSYGWIINNDNLAEFYEELDKFPNIKSEKTLLKTAFQNYSKLPKTINNSANALEFSDNDFYSIYQTIDSLKNTENFNILLECRNVVESFFIQWTDNILIPSLSNKSVSFQLIDASEYAFHSLHCLNDQFSIALANGHIARAKKRSKEGKIAAISLLHLQRVFELKPDLLDANKNILQLTEASLRKANPVTATISIGGDPNIPPILYDLMRSLVATRIKSNTKSYFKWIWQNPDLDKSDIEIYLTDVTAFFPSADDLANVKSQYLSHYQDVPNPQKDILASRLNWAESEVNSAKWAYDSAVSSHNIHPTQMSLNNVNYAYNRYSMAVDAYNSLLRQYQRTPSTISEPVFLPYSFQQGTIRSGWKVAANITAKERKESFRAEQVDSDFVKIGTRSNDKSAANRRDDGIDIDTSNERMISKLDMILEGLVTKFITTTYRLNFDSFPKAEDGEKEILSALYQPFGPTLPPNPKQWVRDAFTNFNLPEGPSTPVNRTINRNTRNINKNNLKIFVSNIESTVCEIQDEFGHGTGTLISDNGLILTCAHVLNGSSLRAIFYSGSHKGTYKCETIFVDETNDVALIKATGLNSKTWANVRLAKNTTKGEKIIAIGNPALDGESTVTVGATQGIVSNPDISFHGTQRIVSDITIASGSSGGPIFSLESGELIAVVTAVGSAGFNQNGGVSSSGYFCLGAPSSYLKDWLGIHY